MQVGLCWLTSSTPGVCRVIKQNLFGRALRAPDVSVYRIWLPEPFDRLRALSEQASRNGSARDSKKQGKLGSDAGAPRAALYSCMRPDARSGREARRRPKIAAAFFEPNSIHSTLKHAQYAISHQPDQQICLTPIQPIIRIIADHIILTRPLIADNMHICEQQP